MKICHKCNKQIKLAFKCEHCNSIQQWTMSEQLIFFKGLSNFKKVLYIGALIIITSITVQMVTLSSSTSSSSSNNSLKESNPDICRCLTDPGNTKWYNDNKYTCRDIISARIGVTNWEQVNFSKNPTLSARWDKLAASCGY